MLKLTFTFLSFLAFLVACYGQIIEEPIKYNDTIILQNEKIMIKIESLMDTYNKFEPEEMDTAYSEAIMQTQEGIDFIKKLQPFKNDSSFKKGTLQLFKAYMSVLATEHKRIIELLKLPDREYDDEEVAEFKELIKSTNEKMDIVLDRLIAIQASFAKRHKFEITNE